MEDGEKKDKAKTEEQSEFLESKAEPRKKRRRGQKKEKPEAFMANFLAGLEIYQTKMLVRTFSQHLHLLNIYSLNSNKM